MPGCARLSFFKALGRFAGFSLGTVEKHVRFCSRSAKPRAVYPFFLRTVEKTRAFFRPSRENAANFVWFAVRTVEKHVPFSQLIRESVANSVRNGGRGRRNAANSVRLHGRGHGSAANSVRSGPRGRRSAANSVRVRRRGAATRRFWHPDPAQCRK